jgi:hypothetical protein
MKAKYSKIFYFLFFSYCSFVGAQTAQELLQSWKEQIEHERLTLIEELQKKYDMHQSAGTKESLDAWKTRTRLDHIRITYCDNSKTYVFYVQLENSLRNHFLPAFSAIYYYYDEKEVLRSVEDLMKIIPYDNEPEISLHMSRKIRFEKKWLMLKSYSIDLYSAHIVFDCRKNKNEDNIDWSKK